MIASSQTPGVYDTTRESFLDLAKMLEKGYSPSVFTDDRHVVLALMPSGPGLQLSRNLIENPLKHLEMRLSQQSKWEQVRAKSEDNEFFIILYCVDAFPSKQTAVKFALAEETKLR